MAQNQPVTRNYTDLQFWLKGVNSYGDPQLIRDDQVRWAVNAVNRGGLWQTRPGFKERFTCAQDLGTHPQFFTLFTPTNGATYAVFGISGLVYTAQALPNQSFGNIQQIPGLSFDPNAPQLVAQATVKSADIVNGRRVVIAPRNVLIIQDGSSRAGFWDGMSAGHLNPQKRWTAEADGSILFAGGYNQTRIGLWMAWSGNRLWVFLGTQGWASDLNDPMNFTEETVLTQVPVFNFPYPVTGAIDRGTSGIQQSLVFVMLGNSVESLRSGVQNRTLWTSTDDFQKPIFKGVGCVAGKSVINHRGLLHWYSADGIVSFDSLGTVNSSQSLPAIDQELWYSKRRICRDRSTICAGYLEAYALWSVPVGPTTEGRVYNGHTQVLDKAVLPAPPDSTGATFGLTEAWQGIWTGIRPVEWATAPLFGESRAFALSKDFDGRIRLWEGFQGNRADNGEQIPWTIETKTHPLTKSPFDTVIFRYFKLLLEQVTGNLDVVGSYKGLRGQYHELLNATITATPGSVLLNTMAYFPYKNSTLTQSFAKQFRELVSPNTSNPGPSGCQSTGVESDRGDAIDRGFSLLLEFRGVGALMAYRLASDVDIQATEGNATSKDETGLRILPEANCPLAIAGALPTYTLPDSPATDALVPYQPRLGEEIYESPAL